MESPSKKQPQLIVSIGIILVAAAALIFFGHYYHRSAAPVAQDASSTDALATDIQVKYTCDANKSALAMYHTDLGSVDLSLSDGRSMTLGLSKAATDTTDPEYSNADGSIVFASENNDVYLQEGANKTYTNCTAALVPAAAPASK